MCSVMFQFSNHKRWWFATLWSLTDRLFGRPELEDGQKHLKCFIIKPTRWTNLTNFILAWNSTLFWTIPLSIIRSLFTVHSAMLYVIQVCRQLSSRTGSCSKALYKLCTPRSTHTTTWNTYCHNTALIIMTYFFWLYLQKSNFGQA